MNSKIKNIFINVLMVLSIIMALSAVAGIFIVIFKENIGSANVIRLIYLAVGELLFMIEIILFGSVGTISIKEFDYYVLTACGVLAILCFLFVLVLKKSKQQANKNAVRGVFYLFMFAFSLTSLIFIVVNGSKIKQVVGVGDNSWSDPIFIKVVLVLSIFIALMIFNVVVGIRQNRCGGYVQNVGSKQLKFYSVDYEEEKQPQNLKSNQQEIEGAVEHAFEAGKNELVNKIIQLNELKDSGEITTVEYTRLRQKLIRKYGK